MNKAIKILIWVSLITGMTSGFCLYQITMCASDDSQEAQIFDATVRYTNDNLVKLIKKDPKTFLLINDIVVSSPFLKKKRNDFIAKYYGQKHASALMQKERLLRTVLASQSK